MKPNQKHEKYLDNKINKMVKQKVLFAMIEAPSYSSAGIVRAWEENEFEVIPFNWQYERFNFGTVGMRNNLIKLAEESQPDLIFLQIQNPEALDLDTIIKLQSIANVIQYTFDVRTKEETEWMYNLARYVHYTFFACYEDVQECVLRGTTNVTLLSSSADYEMYKKYPVQKSQPEIVFVGNNYVGTSLKFDLSTERQDMIEFLKGKYKTNFQAYGLGQSGGIVNPQQEIMIYNSSKIAISHNNFNRMFYTSDRLWRVMGCGTMCLSKHFYGIDKIFQKEVTIDWWKNFDELGTLIDFYLSDNKEREAIAEVGRLMVTEKHTWSDRIKNIKSVL